VNPTEWVAALSTDDGLRLQQGASAHDLDELRVVTAATGLLSVMTELAIHSALTAMATTPCITGPLSIRRRHA
jgi:hypothetical protein